MSMTLPLTTLDDFPMGHLYVGNHVALDLINTAFENQQRRYDLLTRFSDLLTWMQGAQLLTADDAEQMRREFDHHPQAHTVLIHITTLRHLLKKIVLQKDRSSAAFLADLAEFNAFIQNFTFYLALNWTPEGGLGKNCHCTLPRPLSLLEPIIQASMDLLTQSDHDLIRQCENEACAMVFLDICKNKSRRWCSMELCGNRMKVNAYRERLKTSRAKTGATAE